MRDALIMIIYGNRQNFFCIFLTYYILVKYLFDFPWFWELGIKISAFFIIFTCQNILALLNTFIADIYARP